jgi:hypothetical protein
MPSAPKNRSQVITAALILLLVAAGVVFYFYSSRRAPAPGVKSKDGGIVNVDPSQVPTGFARGIPFFYQTEILRNYYVVDANGQFQATRSFVSSSSAPVVYKMYQDFFLKAGWNVSPDYHPKITSQQIFNADKAGNRATVAVDSVLTAATANAQRETVVTLNFFMQTSNAQ